MQCQKCGYGNPTDAQTCGLCSELLVRLPVKLQPTIGGSKSFLQLPPINPIGEDTSQERPDSTSGDRPASSLNRHYPLILFIAGLVVYPVISYFRFFYLMCEYLAVLIHELGHSLMYLAFGQLAIPKLNFVYGGGWAVPITDSSKLGPIVIIGLLLLFIYLNRGHKPSMISLIIITAIYPFLAFSKAQDILVGGAGHLCEAVAAGICFYRCLIAGNALSFERPIYAVLGWWITFHGIGFCWQLGTDVIARAVYIADPVRYHDLARIADYTNWSFGFIALIFGIAYLLPALSSVSYITWKTIK